jgi:hypothetical protein
VLQNASDFSSESATDQSKQATIDAMPNFISSDLVVLGAFVLLSSV